MKHNRQKIFLVFNTAGFGDVLLCNPLCQNIRLQYPDSKIVFVVSKTFAQAAEYQKDVDDIVIYDKKGEHKGFFGLIKFILSFKYKNAFCSFLTYKNTRNFLIALLTGSKHIIKPQKSSEKMSERHSALLKKISDKEVLNLPMIYIPEKIVATNFDFLGKNYIALCPVCENSEKNIPQETTAGIIRELNNRGYKVVFTGVGEYSRNYAEVLKKQTEDFTDLTDKTSIKDLAYVLKNSKGLISVDTGTMHLGCACSVPVVSMFYRENTVDTWAPDEKIYNSKTLFRENDAKKICDILLALMNNVHNN